MPRIPVAVLGGAVAAAGSALGKYATGADSVIVRTVVETCSSSFPPRSSSPSPPSSLSSSSFPLDACSVAGYLTRGALIVVMMVTNTYALALNLRGMAQLGSVLSTVLFTGTNFAASALVGWLFFGEALSLLWWCGAACIVAGTVLVSSAGAKEGAEQQRGTKRKEEAEKKEGVPPAETATEGSVRRRRPQNE